MACTPEERVRQWFVGILTKNFGVPSGLVGTEVTLKYGGKTYRADIVVYRRDSTPLAIVECKRPEVTLGRDTVVQAARYHSCLNVDYLFITNGKTTYAAGRTAEGYSFINKIPTYEEMTK